MKKLLIVATMLLTFAGCSSSSTPATIDVTVDGATKTITPQWLDLENGDQVAIDAETGNKYAENEAGEWVKYVPSN